MQSTGQWVSYSKEVQKLWSSMENCLLIVFSTHFYIVLSSGKIPHEYTILICLSYRGKWSIQIVYYLLKSGFCFIIVESSYLILDKVFCQKCDCKYIFFQPVTCLFTFLSLFYKAKVSNFNEAINFFSYELFYKLCLTACCRFFLCFFRHFIILCFIFRFVIYLTLLFV